jgi:hypothetical protein
MLVAVFKEDENTVGAVEVSGAAADEYLAWPGVKAVSEDTRRCSVRSRRKRVTFHFEQNME